VAITCDEGGSLSIALTIPSLLLFKETVLGLAALREKRAPKFPSAQLPKA